jgi:hypothetical protein
MSDDSRTVGAAAVTVVLWASAFVSICTRAGISRRVRSRWGRLLVASLAFGVVWLLGGWLLHEGFPRRLAAGMAVSFGRVLVVGISESDGGRTSVIGVVLCLVAAVCYAAGVACQKLALRHASAIQVTAFGCFTGIVTNLIMPSKQTL